MLLKSVCKFVEVFDVQLFVPENYYCTAPKEIEANGTPVPQCFLDKLKLELDG